MVKTEVPAKKDYNESEILKSVYEKMGGKPSNFYKATVTQVNSDSFRVNIYASDSVGFMNQYKIIHSVFYVLPNS